MKIAQFHQPKTKEAVIVWQCDTNLRKSIPSIKWIHFTFPLKSKREKKNRCKNKFHLYVSLYLFILFYYHHFYLDFFLSSPNGKVSIHYFRFPLAITPYKCYTYICVYVRMCNIFNISTMMLMKFITNFFSFNGLFQRIC